MAKTVLGLFEEQKNVEMVIDRLKNEGYNPKDLSIVMKDVEGGEELAADTGANVAGGAVSGATGGAVLGGIAGLVASYVIPGLGAFFIGGPIAAALGLTGAAASTVSGAATGALAGGLLGVLTGLGLSIEDAQEYEELIKGGAILLAVPAMDHEEEKVEQMLMDADASDVTTVSSGKFEKEEIAGSQESGGETFRRPAYATVGTKGGRVGRPRKAKATGSKKGRKGGRAKAGSRGKRGWFGDSKGHSLAGQGKNVPDRGR